VLARTLIVALAAALLLALGAAPASATHSRGKCKAKGTTVAKNDSARVYEREEEAEVRTTLYGCLWSKNRPVKLQSASGSDPFTFEEYGQVRLRGHFVTWEFTSTDGTCKAACPPNYDATQEFVNVFNLKTRRGDYETSNATDGSLRLNSTGAAAWLSPADGSNTAVNSWDGDGFRTIETGSIRRWRLRGRTLSWINGDQPKTATLRGAAIR
jgi:hypothetical protein